MAQLGMVQRGVALLSSVFHGMAWHRAAFSTMWARLARRDPAGHGLSWHSTLGEAQPSLAWQGLAQAGLAQLSMVWMCSAWDTVWHNLTLGMAAGHGLAVGHGSLLLSLPAAAAARPWGHFPALFFPWFLCSLGPFSRSAWFIGADVL